ncbi:PDZ domain-containing protein [Candidatus Thorarchaeota archaeon]|nr:MAG: PDZ domain-containing protein [Candidatus Thorarchaeota archaeon]
MDPIYLLGILAGVYLLVYVIAQIIGQERLSERGIEAGTPFFIMLKTERLNSFLTRLGKKIPRWFFNLGVVVGFGGMIAGFVMFADNLLRFFIQPQSAGGVVPIIPGITITGLPLVYLMIALAFTLIVHEFAHGLASSRDNIPIKSSGLMAFFVLFGAFVEPDEEVFENEASSKDRMRMLAAGSFSNLIWAFVVLLMIANFPAMMSLGFNPPNGAYVYDIVPGSPAAQALEVGDVIVGLNDTDIDRWAEVSQFMIDAPAGSQLTIHTLEGTETIILAASEGNSSMGYIGVYGADYWEPKPGWEWILGGPLFAFHVQQVLTWSFIIQFSVALFNLLPIPFLDGERLLSNGLNLLTDDEKKIRMVMWPLRIASLLIVILSIVLSFWFGKGLF